MTSKREPDGRLPLASRSWPAWLLLALLVVAAMTLAITAIDPELLIDEPQLLGPVGQHLESGRFPVLKYPEFFYRFYETAIRLARLLGRGDTLLQTARAVNLLLYGLSILLFYLVSRRDLGRWFALVAAFFYAFAPAVFFSAVVVKTESLLLVELLVVVLCLQALLAPAGGRRHHALAGLFSALSIATKFNVVPALTYLLVSKYVHGVSWRRWPRLLLRRDVLLFFGVLLLVLPIAWPGLWNLQGWFEVYRRDPYFEDAATTFRAVDEWLAFPYGRYSSALLTTLPMVVGHVVYPLGIAALFAGVVPRELLMTVGFSSLAFLALALHVTLLRVPHAFTLVVPFFAVASAALLRRGWESARARSPAETAGGVVRFLAAFSLAGVMLLSLYERAAVVRLYYQLFGTVQGAVREARFMIVADTLDQSRTPDRAPMEDGVARYHPERLIILDSYVYNFCKYRTNPTYAANCEYFRRLVAGQAAYELERTVEIDFPFKRLSFDPEMSLTFYCFRRPAAPATDDAARGGALR